MGIKNLNKLIRNRCPEVFEEKDISDFSFKKIAIDTSLYVCKYKVIYGDEWFKNIFWLIAKLREEDIHSVFIFDSGAPKEKDVERQERKQQQQFLKDKIFNLETALDIYRKTKNISPVLEKYTTKRFLTNHTELSIDKVELDISKYKRQVITKSTEDFKLVKKLLDILKIPYYDAPMEAECLASDLCKRGIIDGVLSEDTDCLTYGSSILISKFNPTTGKYIEISFENLLKKLKLSNDQFIDLCIMCGCDYNKNIPKIGPITSYNLILQYKSIEGVETNTELNTDILNYKRSRELFKNYERMSLSSVPYCGIPDKKEVLIFLKENGVFITEEYVEKSFIHTVFVFE